MDENGCLYVKYELYVKYCCAGFVSEAPAVGHSTPALSQEDSKTDSTVILSDESPQGKRSRPNRSDAHAVSIFFVAHWLQIIQPCPGPLSHLSQNTNVTRESSQMKDNSWPVAMEIHNSACSLQSYICPTQSNGNWQMLLINAQKPPGSIQFKFTVMCSQISIYQQVLHPAVLSFAENVCVVVMCNDCCRLK